MPNYLISARAFDIHKQSIADAWFLCQRDIQGNILQFLPAGLEYSIPMFMGNFAFVVEHYCFERHGLWSKQLSRILFYNIPDSHVYPVVQLGTLYQNLECAVKDTVPLAGIDEQKNALETKNAAIDTIRCNLIHMPSYINYYGDSAMILQNFIVKLSTQGLQNNNTETTKTEATLPAKQEDKPPEITIDAESSSDEEESVAEEPPAIIVTPAKKKKKKKKKAAQAPASPSFSDQMQPILSWSYNQFAAAKNLVTKPDALLLFSMNWSIAFIADHLGYIDRFKLSQAPREFLTPAFINTAGVMACSSAALLYAKQKIKNA